MSSIFGTKTCACGGACSGESAPRREHDKQGSCCDNHSDHDHSHDHDHGDNADDGHSHGEEENPQAVRNEIKLLVGSAVLFFGTMIFESDIASALGVWTVRFCYAIPYLLCGISIYRSAWDGLRKGNYLNEFTLMCGATVAAIILGDLPEAVGVMLFYRTGEFFQDLAASGSRRSIKSLLASKPDVAHVIENGQAITRNVEDVEAGAHIEVRAGEKVPLDGVVLSGNSQLDQSPLTGESVPVSASPGTAVLGGSINLSGVLTVEVQTRFADSHMARILDMVENAAQRKSPTERFITRFARYYTPAVVAIAVLVAIVPPLFVAGQTFETWVYRALVMLVISCPCALLISIPLGYFGGIGAASREGILVKGGNVFDSVLHVDTVVFDKTGTLTLGVFDVAEISPAAEVSENELLQAAGIAEQSSNHPIARSILSHLQKHDITVESSEGASVHELSGKGMEVELNGVTYLAGTAALLKERGVDTQLAGANQADFGALVYVAKNGRYLGRIRVTDCIKPEAKDAINALHSKGLKTFMLTGDNAAAAEWVAKETGIGGFKANLLPEDKVRAMHEMDGMDNSGHTAFVGDGINDAPILALSRVGIAMGGIGAGAAVEAADAVVLNDSPARVARLFGLAGDVRKIVWQNIVLALGVKTSFMCLGVVGLSGLWEAVFADVGVALLAVLNSTRIMWGKKKDI